MNVKKSRWTGSNLPHLPGVEIRSIGPELPVLGKPQDILVTVQPHGRINLHTHDVDATMIVVAGSAEVLGDPEARMAGPGDIVHFGANEPHGFAAGPQGLVFISKNGGIVGADGGLDLVPA